MNNAIPFTTCLLSAHLVGGALWLVFLLALCFVGVHIVKIAQAKKKKPPEPKNESKAEEPPSPQEPIYYIVEKKQRRAKAKYGEPKEIHFK